MPCVESGLITGTAAHAFCECRQLSYEGAAFKLTKLELEPIFQVQYGYATAMWQLLDMVIHRTEVFASRTKALRGIFWGANQRFFRQLLMAAKVSAVVDAAQGALAQGMSVVIGLQSTGEATLKEQKEINGAARPMPVWHCFMHTRSLARTQARLRFAGHRVCTARRQQCRRRDVRHFLEPSQVHGAHSGQIPARLPTKCEQERQEEERRQAAFQAG